MNKDISILNVSFSSRTMEETASYLDEILDRELKDKTFQVATANPEFVMIAKDSRSFRRILREAGLVTADGIGVVIGSKILGEPLPERVAGYDTLHLLLNKREDSNKKTTIFCVGAKREIIEQAVGKLKEMYSHVEVVGYRDGYFKAESDEEKELVKQISEAKPDLLLVGLGAPRQEEFIFSYKEEFKAKVAIGVGGTFDVLSGNVKRAPLVFQKLYLEWLWRIIKQPSRWRRQLVLPKFVLEVLKEKMKNK